MILSPHYHYHRLHTWMSAVRPWHSETLPPGLQYIYGCLIIRYMCRLSSREMACEITVKNLVWYSGSVHPEKWHALYDVNACENHYPGKWQAMHDANACENYIAIILWQQSPCFKCMWNHQCIATQSPCDYRLSIKPPLLNKNHQCIATQSPCYCRLFIKPTLKKNYMNLNDGNRVPTGKPQKFSMIFQWYFKTKIPNFHDNSERYKIKLEQLERLHSEDTPRRLMITYIIESYWFPSQKNNRSRTENVTEQTRFQSQGRIYLKI